MNAPRESPDGWRPSGGLAASRQRATMLGYARQFFADHGILEVDTPALSRSAVTDPAIESISASVTDDPGHDVFLHTSPEFAMKRLLCAGWPDIFQICKVFRDGEIGRRHQPEFTMVEWYRLNVNLWEMMDHTADFIAGLLPREKLAVSPEYLSYQEAFIQHAGVDPLRATVAELREAAGADRDLAASLGENRDHWLDLLMSSRVAAGFRRDRLTVLHHYPASQAALARLCPEYEKLAERFEIFFGELELANGYRELTDASQQRQRFLDDQATRRESQQPVRPLDEALLAAMTHGLPDCCGVAVGLDRLLMIALDTGDIRTVQSFCFPEPA
ncbi:MAG: EF-P lysine aminoacylase EpmA [Woeseia sp.]